MLIELKQRVIIQIAIGVGTTLLALGYTFAGEVNFIPSVSVSESYSDNISLAPAGDEQGEFVTEISPAFTLQMTGNRFNANVAYSLQDLRYLKESDRNRTFSQLSANSTAEIVDDSFFFDVYANRNQQIVDADQPVSNNNIAITGNRVDVTNYSFSPYYNHTFSNFLEALVSYTYSDVDFRSDSITDSVLNGTQVKLNSPTNTIGMVWGLDYSKQSSDYESGSNTEFTQGSLSLGYRFTSRMFLSASSGKEENTFSQNASQNINSSFWNVDIEWQVGARNSISIGYGDRYFGNTERFVWQHSGQRLNFRIEYDEKISNFALSILQNQQNTNTVGTQNQILNNAGSITNQTYVQALGRFTLNYNFSKTSIFFQYSNETRKFQETEGLIKLTNANFLFSLNSSSVLTYILGTTWNRNYTSTTNIKSFNTYINFAIQRKLSPSMDATISLKHNLRNASNAGTNYTESIVSIGLSKTFN